MKVSWKTWLCSCVLLCGAVSSLTLSSCRLEDARQSESVTQKDLAPIAVHAEGGRVWVAGHDSRRLDLLDAVSGVLMKSVSLSQPPTGMYVDNGLAYITEGGPNGVVEVVDLAAAKVLRALSVGHTPMSPIVRGKSLYVANRFNNQVMVLDTESGKVMARYQTSREPIALAVSSDGQTIWAANHLPPGVADGESTSACLTRIRGGQSEAYPLCNGSQGVRGLAMSPDGKYLAMTHVLSRYQVPTTQLDRGWMNTNAVTLVDTQHPEKMIPVLLDDASAGAANPWAVAFDGEGKQLLVTHAGTQELSVIDFPSLLRKLEKMGPKGDGVATKLGFLHGVRRRVSLPLNGPRSVSSDGEFAYVAGYYSDSIAKVSLKAGHSSQSLTMNPYYSPSDERLGEQAFNDATLCFQGWQSCATCHPDARVDGLDWDLLNDGMGNPKNTRTMLITHRSSPVMSLGVRASAEVAVKAGFVHIQFFEPPPVLIDRVNQYLRGMSPVPSPHLIATQRETPKTKDASCALCHGAAAERGVLNESATRGKVVFKKAGCTQCHPHPFFTTKQLIATGTAKGVDEGKKILVPSLIEVWRTGPYLHDGRAKTIREAITTHNVGDIRGKTSDLTERELVDLVEYVSSL